MSEFTKGFLVAAGAVTAVLLVGAVGSFIRSKA